MADALLSALQSLDTDTHEVQREYSHFGGHLPVDVAILQHNKVVALVEIDGPSHYRRDGSLTRKSQFKEAVYRQALPDVLFQRVHYLEEEYVDACDFSQALSAAHSGPELLRMWQGFVRRMRAFLR